MSLNVLRIPNLQTKKNREGSVHGFFNQVEPMPRAGSASCSNYEAAVFSLLGINRLRLGYATESSGEWGAVRGVQSDID